ncbi:putative transcription factor interactor and regulator CCHC(Zn) family [Helianthus anomalus]
MANGYDKPEAEEIPRKNRNAFIARKVGFNKSKLRCYNCKNPGHYKRDFSLLKSENAETALAKRTIAIEGNDNSTPNTPKKLVVEDYDWTEEIAEENEEVNKALMAKISTGSASSSSSSGFVEKQAA